jgi:2-polyprenyl-6-hydroxyphenyl methylase/3-demethylubiquinone-9 3-methyltransferase
MTTEAFEEQQATRAEAYDTSSDPNFVAYYAAESQTPATQERFTRVRDRALELLADAGRTGPFDVVDIGCGAGTPALLWAKRGHRVRALDINEPLVTIGRQRAQQAGLPVEFEVGTATALPYADRSADVVLLPELLEHVVEWERCLEEAVRVLRPVGLLYLSTSNWLCPVQQEFTLPAYSWYPAPVKRWCERKALTTHPHWVEHARYPAVNWFSYYSLSRWLAKRGFRTFDRFDVLARQPLGRGAGLAVRTVRSLPPLRLLAHAATEGTTVWAIRR